MNDINILMVEDEVITGLSIQKMFSSLGYTNVDFVYSGEKALECAKLKKPNLFLTDINLGRGKIDGIETAKIMKKEHNVPIIFMTAYGDEETKRRSEAVSPLAFLRKPVYFQLLSKVIADYIQPLAN